MPPSTNLTYTGSPIENLGCRFVSIILHGMGVGAAEGEGASAAAVGVGASAVVAMVVLARPPLCPLSAAGVEWLVAEVLVRFRAGAGAGGDGEKVGK